MSDFRVSVSGLKTKVDTLRQLNSKFKSQVEEMSGAEEHLNGMWEGQAKDAFHSAFQRDRTQMDNFYNEIEVYAQHLESIAAEYSQAELKNIEIANERNY